MIFWCYFYRFMIHSLIASLAKLLNNNSTDGALYQITDNNFDIKKLFSQIITK